MSVATLPRPKKAEATPPEIGLSEMSIRRFTVEEYHKLIEIGVLKSGDPYELLHGWIVKKMSVNNPRRQAVSRLYRWFTRNLSDEWYTCCQQPFTTGDSEPEPDISVSIGPDRLYDDRKPGPTDLALVVEVSDSTLVTDSNYKLNLYAEAGVDQYWIVKLVAHRVEVYTQPHVGQESGYKSCVHYAKGSDIPLVLGGKSVGSLPVSEFLA